MSTLLTIACEGSQTVAGGWTDRYADKRRVLCVVFHAGAVALVAHRVDGVTENAKRIACRLDPAARACVDAADGNGRACRPSRR